MSRLRKSLVLETQDWGRLLTLAKRTRSLYSGRPSWRRLIRRLAQGEFQLCQNNKNQP